MGKRKDNKGRVLKDGESQRKNGSYDFRYTDVKGKRRYVYAKTLTALRKKEADIQRDIMDEIDSMAGEVTVSELVDRYMDMQRGLKKNSLRAYSSAVNRIHDDPFGQRPIKSVKLSDAKRWFLSLHDNGLKQNTIGVIQSVIRPAFEMAVDDDAIRKNPFKFKLCDLIPNDAYVRDALSREWQGRYLEFIRDYGKANYYNDIEILLHTGLRVSELYGLTKADVDLDKRCVHINKQLCRTGDKPYFITEPKTKSGIRDIPLSDSAYMAFCRVIQSRPVLKVEAIIDGRAGFLFLDKNGKPKVAMHLQNYMRNMQKKFTRMWGPEAPRVTPHVLRHTFCTNAQQAGIDVKSLQAIMGHSNVSVTLDVYTHTDYEAVESAFRKVAASL